MGLSLTIWKLLVLFSPPGLPCPPSMWEILPCLNMPCFVMFGCCPSEACYFLREVKVSGSGGEQRWQREFGGVEERKQWSGMREESIFNEQFWMRLVNWYYIFFFCFRATLFSKQSWKSIADAYHYPHSRCSHNAFVTDRDESLLFTWSVTLPVVHLHLDIFIMIWLHNYDIAQKTFSV